MNTLAAPASHVALSTAAAGSSQTPPLLPEVTAPGTAPLAPPAPGTADGRPPEVQAPTPSHDHGSREAHPRTTEAQVSPDEAGIHRCDPAAEALHAAPTAAAPRKKRALALLSPR